MVWNTEGMERSLGCGGTWAAAAAEPRNGSWYPVIVQEQRWWE